MPKLAFMTYGWLIAPFGDPSVQGFTDRVPTVYQSADNTPGFVGRSIRDMESYSHSWGEVVTPKCWGGEHSPKAAATLSIWDVLESVSAFAFHGSHGEAMKLRK